MCNLVLCINVSIHFFVQECIHIFTFYTSVYPKSFFILHHEMRISYLLDYYHHHIYHVCMSMTLVRVCNRVFCRANIISIRLCAYTFMVQYGVHCIGVKNIAYPSIQLFLLLALRSFYANILQGCCNYC